MKNILLLSLLAVFTFGCGSGESNTNTEEVVDEKLSEQEQQQQIYDEVMGLHDELMPQMKELYDMRTVIIERADSLEEAGVDSESLRSTIAELESGEEAMMDWMRNFEMLPEETPHDSVMNYLTHQREKIMEVKVLMEQAFAKGEETIKN